MRNRALSARADHELIDVLRDERSEAVFRELHRRHTPRLLRLIMRMLGSADGDAEDLVQETWIRAVEKLSSFRGEAQFGTWLTRIGIRMTLDYLREGKRAHLPMGQAAEPMSCKPTHDERMDLEQVFACLPNGYRTVLLLHDLEGFTHAEIGEILGIPEGTSKSRLNAARKLAQVLFDGGTPSEAEHALTDNVRRIL